MELVPHLHVTAVLQPGAVNLQCQLHHGGLVVCLTPPQARDPGPGVEPFPALQPPGGGVRHCALLRQAAQVIQHLPHVRRVYNTARHHRLGQAPDGQSTASYQGNQLTHLCKTGREPCPAQQPPLLCSADCATTTVQHRDIQGLEQDQYSRMSIYVNAGGWTEGASTRKQLHEKGPHTRELKGDRSLGMPCMHARAQCPDRQLEG